MIDHYEPLSTIVIITSEYYLQQLQNYGLAVTISRGSHHYPMIIPFFCIFIIVPTWVDFMFTIPPTLETSPIPTKENFADLETKKLSADRMRYLMHGVGVCDESAGELVGTDVVTRERFFFCFSFFFFRARCLSAGLRS